MSMEFSNKGLAFLLVVAIVISLGGTIISLNRLNQLGITGRAADEGTASLELNTVVAVTFTQDSVNFGNGSVNSTVAGMFCNLTTTGEGNDSGGCLGALHDASPFIIQNDGNVPVILELKSDKTNATFIGGTNPVFKWKLSDEDPDVNDSCNGPIYHNDTWYPVNNSDQIFCAAFQPMYATTNGSTLRLDIRVGIPQDAPKGVEKTATITATGTA